MSAATTELLPEVRPATGRPVFSFHVALGALLVIWVFIACRPASVSDPDIWWHLQNAQYLFTHHAFPSVDSFSYTATGSPWINHEWLAEIPYYLAWRAWNVQGVCLVWMVLAELIFLGVFSLSYQLSGSVKGAFLACCFAVILARVNFGPRTILFGWLCMLALLWLLWRFRTDGKGPLWAIPILFCVWANTHGSWLLGLIVGAIFFAAGMVSGEWGQVEAVAWTAAQRKRIAATAAASVAALFVNPFGYRLVWYPFDLAFRQKLNIGHVEEWASVDFHTAWGKVVLVGVAALLAAILLDRRRWRLEELGLIAFGLYASLTYIRFLFLAAILITPIIAKSLRFLPPYRREVDKPILNALVVAAAVVYLVGYFPSAQTLKTDIAEHYPDAAIAYVTAHAPGARIFNNYVWGGYLIWTAPQLPTFVDSRTDIFEYNGVLQDYLDAIAIKRPLEVFDKYQVRFVLHVPNQPLSYVLSKSNHWKIDYQDGKSILFERINEPGEAR